MNTKHTPGPWKTEANDYIFTHSGQPIAHTSIRSNNEEQAANARLIAAAPELLETAKNLMGMIKMIGLQYPPEWETKVEKTIEAATAAIARAEGNGAKYNNKTAEQEEGILDDIETRTNYDRF